MTNPNATHITLIADRTGSMNQVREEAEGGINAFLDDQRKLPDECTLLLVDFDDVEPFRIVHDGAIQQSEQYRLMPRGNTPLYDAIGKGIVLTGERLAALDEDRRPGKVIFVIQTDGKENASREYRLDQIREMITEQTNKWQWTFVYLASGPVAWDAAQAFAGTQLGRNVLRSSGRAKGMTATASYLSDVTSNVRSGAVAVASAYAGQVDIDDEGKLTAIDDEGEQQVKAKRATPLP